MSLSSSVKKQITDWYKDLQKQIPDFVTRPAQRTMIAEVAKTLSGEADRHLAIEAPTGVGKTLSYLIPGIAIARSDEKTLVVSTANVALQDQIYSKDLPLLKKLIPDLRFTAAFGRSRYVCPRNMALLSSDNSTQTDLLAAIDDLSASNKKEQELCQSLERAFNKETWDGLRDHYPKNIDDALWAKLSTDKPNCLGKNCYAFSHCPFFLARKEIESSDVVVANHALVMAAMETESVLPQPKKLLLVLDEGHHVPDVARDAFEVSAEITALATKHQIELITRNITQIMEIFRPKNPPQLAADKDKLAAHGEEMAQMLLTMESYFNALIPGLMNEGEYRFEMGALPDEMAQLCNDLYKMTDALRGCVEYILNELTDATGQHDIVRLHRNILQMSRSLGYLENLTKLWRLAAMPDVSGAPISKWATRSLNSGQMQLIFHCVGIRVCDQLEKLLWHKVPHIVITSATLRSLNSFKRLQELSGLSEKKGDRFVALDSPFNHPEQGKLLIPQMKHEPIMAKEAEHLAEMACYFRSQVKQGEHKGMLVLFSSHRAMKTFLSYVDDLRDILLVQGDQPRYVLVEEHHKRVKQSKLSVLIGLQSFAEGLDLKGELLTQVHIHKIAFPPIDNPIILTEGEWLQTQKRHSFEVQSLPSASFNLIQQVGRLIRSHSCKGEVVIYDRRLLTKNYGPRLLGALPVFPIEQPKMPDMSSMPKPAATEKSPPKRRRKAR